MRKLRELEKAMLNIFHECGNESSVEDTNPQRNDND